VVSVFGPVAIGFVAINEQLIGCLIEPVRQEFNMADTVLIEWSNEYTAYSRRYWWSECQSLVQHSGWHFHQFVRDALDSMCTALGICFIVVA
jgi:hypothetical protein